MMFNVHPWSPGCCYVKKRRFRRCKFHRCRVLWLGYIRDSFCTLRSTQRLSRTQSYECNYLSVFLWSCVNSCRCRRCSTLASCFPTICVAVCTPFMEEQFHYNMHHLVNFSKRKVKFLFFHLLIKKVNDPRALTCGHHPFVNDCHLANNKSLNHTAFSCAYYATNAPILIAYLFKLFEISTSYASRNWWILWPYSWKCTWQFNKWKATSGARIFRPPVLSLDRGL